MNYAGLGIKIKDIRQNRGLTQDSLAELVGCNTSHISNIENNHTKVSLNVLLAIANALDTSIDYLLSEQYGNPALALDNEILRALKNCDNQKKEKILRIIEII
ncbi:MAG: helix-turn-helix domain-containing protein [Lachnospiraceae bacterium]|nr:helix-turn-helix domain-containing protein [Lachnospiraceae bacterium]